MSKEIKRFSSFKPNTKIHLDKTTLHPFLKFIDDQVNTYNIKKRRNQFDLNYLHITQKVIDSITELRNKEKTIYEIGINLSKINRESMFIAKVYGNLINRNHEKVTCLEIINQVSLDIERFAELSPYVFEDTDMLTHRHYFIDLVKKYEKPYRSYLFLYLLPSFVDENTKDEIKKSFGYNFILENGPDAINIDFWRNLLKRFGSTRTSINSQAAANLAQEVNELQEQHSTQLINANNKINDLESKINNIQNTAKKEAMINIFSEFSRMPDGPLLVFDDLYVLLNEQENLSSNEIRLLNALDPFFNIISNFGLERFPSNKQEVFEITKSDLFMYAYASGSPFSEESFIKQVKCTKFGWKLDEKILTPATVVESKI